MPDTCNRCHCTLGEHEVWRDQGFCQECWESYCSGTWWDMIAQLGRLFPDSAALIEVEG